MTENGDPIENAIAERVNGTIKEEYLNDYCVSSLEQAKELLAAVVKLYNNERPHQSIGYLPPPKIFIKERLWKNYYKKTLTL